MDSGSVYIRNIPTHLPEYTTLHPRRKQLLRFENLTTWPPGCDTVHFITYHRHGRYCCLQLQGEQRNRQVL